MSDAPQQDIPKTHVSPLQFVKGVGPKRAEALAQAGILTPRDLLMYIPRSYIDRSSIGNIRTLHRRMLNPDVFDKESRETIEALRSEITIVGAFTKIREHQFGKGRKMLIATFSDGSGADANVIFFNFIEYFRRVVKQEEVFAVSGKPDLDKFGKVTFTHPDIERIDPEDEELYKAGKIIPKYTLTQPMKNANIGMRGFRNLVELVIDQEKPNINEVLPASVLHEYNFPNRSAA
ncbi:MAG: hypothetical protein JNJ85_09025, partial [Candidatus Kapabacteria bacterium]|nr:hypothetical protein [Candidatus Kapabacteria bacterium]